MQQLTAQNEDLTSTVETLKEELVASNHEAERAHSELDHVRSRTLLESTQESMLRERELREAQTELERCRMERDEWERTAQQERLAAEESRAYERDLEHERDNSERLYAELEAEKEKSANLQSVLQDFQAGRVQSSSGVIHLISPQPRTTNSAKLSKSSRRNSHRRRKHWPSSRAER